ncbi:MAG: TetR/AcrR family transcriptional regulator [Pseudomonadota bacterium]|nr:TetR/AcrR family transcriptional regulator [Pseudomonadota bacterium]
MIKKIKDGRKLRSQNTSDHILSTIIRLAREGNQDINFDVIAKEAKLGTRTIFRHFEDKDALLEALNKKVRESIFNNFPKKSENESLEKRMKSLISFLCDMYSKNKNLYYWTAINIVQSEQVYKNALTMYKLHRMNILKTLPEIESKDRREQEAIFQILSFGFWRDMRLFSKKKKKEIEEILIFNLKKHLSTK